MVYERHRKYADSRNLPVEGLSRELAFIRKTVYDEPVRNALFRAVDAFIEGL